VTLFYADVIKRIVHRRRKGAERKPYYDEKDREALKLMRKLRVDWSDQEDSFLLICKVAGAYLCQFSRTAMVSYTAVRDLMHKHFPESHNKTSRACQRRLNYMMKNGATADNVTLFLADVQRDAAVSCPKILLVFG
jgi:general transcription factor 3C polypeptide 1